MTETGTHARPVADQGYQHTTPYLHPERTRCGHRTPAATPDRLASVGRLPLCPECFPPLTSPPVTRGVAPDGRGWA